MADDKISLPMGSGGLTRYNEEDNQGIKIKPEVVIGVLIAIVLFEIVLRLID